MSKKRIIALIGLILIGLFYLATLVLAFIDSPFARSCLMAALFGTIVVPAVLYGYMIFTGSHLGPSGHNNGHNGQSEDEKSGS